jgi:hypothetical protein
VGKNKPEGLLEESGMYRLPADDLAMPDWAVIIVWGSVALFSLSSRPLVLSI